MVNSVSKSSCYYIFTKKQSLEQSIEWLLYLSLYKNSVVSHHRWNCQYMYKIAWKCYWRCSFSVINGSMFLVYPSVIARSISSLCCQVVKVWNGKKLTWFSPNCPILLLDVWCLRYFSDSKGWDALPEEVALTRVLDNGLSRRHYCCFSVQSIFSDNFNKY